MKKTTKFTLILSAICCAAFALCFFAFSGVPKAAYADGLTEAVVSGKYEGHVDYGGATLENYSKRTTASSDAPAITVLVHGQGGQASHWCNYGGGPTLVCNSDSVIERVRMAAGEGTAIYLAKAARKYVECSEPNPTHLWKTDNDGNGYYQCSPNCERVFTLKKLTRGSQIFSGYYQYNYETTSKITDFSKHIIIIFEASDTEFITQYENGAWHTHTIYGGEEASHDVAYAELNYVIDRIVADYRYITGVIPKINLISHSRGGILSMKYAIAHPYNVANMISLGTPYAGSIFAGADLIVDGLGLRDDLECPSGQDIVSVSVQTTLKNQWNAMLNSYPAANINAVAIGSKTRLDFISGLIAGGYINNQLGITDEYAQNLLAVLTKYFGVAIARLNDTYPASVIASTIFDCFNLGIDVVQLLVDDYTASQIEAYQRIINNCEIAYGDLVIKDDLFIHYDSQIAQGFNGFTRYGRVFSSLDAEYNLRSTSAPPVPHNLETRDPLIVNMVLSELTFGSYRENVYGIDTYNNLLSGTFTAGDYSEAVFDALLDGDYTVVNAAVLNFAVIEIATGNVVAASQSNDYVFRGEKNKQYRIFIYLNVNAGTYYGTLKVRLPDVAFAHGYVLESDETSTFMRSYQTTTAKTFEFGFIILKIYAQGNLITQAHNNQVDLIFLGGVEYFFEMYNFRSYQYENVFPESDVLGLQEGVDASCLLYRDGSVVSFTASTAGAHTFSLRCPDINAIIEIYVYDANFNIKTSTMVFNFQNHIIYQFNLIAGEKVYFSFFNYGLGTRPTTVQVRRYVSDYYWMHDGMLLQNFVLELQRNDEYSGTLTFHYNGEQLIGQMLPITESNAYLSVDGANSKVKVRENTPLTYGEYSYQYLVWQALDGDARLNEALKIKVLPKNAPTVSATESTSNFKFHILYADRQTFNSLSETVSVQVRVRNYMGNFYDQDVLITSGSAAYYVDLINSYGYYRSATIDLSVIGITYYYNNYSATFNTGNYPNLFSSQTATLVGHFHSGNGSSVPYLITGATHLNNVRYAAHPTINGGYVLDASFKLSRDIHLSNNWQPIETAFSGHFDGNNKAIFNLTIHAHASGGLYGLFSTIDSGIVENLTLYDVNIYGSTNNNASYICVGAVAGYNFNGIVRGCFMDGGSITIFTYKSMVGGFVGLNLRSIYNCQNYGTPITGCGIIGGITGVNGGGLVQYCNNRATISYYYDTENGCAAGIAGKVSGGGYVANCSNNGLIRYTGEPSNSQSIEPCMAQIVGWLQNGTQTDNTCSGSTDFSNLKTPFLGFIGHNQRKYCSNGAVGRTGGS